MRAFAQASVEAVECKLDGNVNVLLVYLAVGTSVFGVAQARAIVAPDSVTAVIGASLH